MTKESTIVLVVVISLQIVSHAWSKLPEALKITPNKDNISIEYKARGFLWQIIADTIFIDKQAYPLDKCSSGSNEVCYQWGSIAQFLVKNHRSDDRCQQFFYCATIPNMSLKVNIDIKNMHIYGGPERNTQLWPAEKMSFKEQPYISLDADMQSVLESYWLTSKGFYIYVDNTVPLFITLDSKNKIFTLISKNSEPYMKPYGNTNLTYTICNLENAREAHEHAVMTFLGKPPSLPDVKMVEHPIWSTWARYKAEINESIVLKFANEIVENNFKNSQLEIDDNWETCYGSLTLNRTSFPNMKRLVGVLKTLGFRVTLWVHPFINVDCEPYYGEAKKFGYLVRAMNGSYNTRWWKGNAGLIDFTNPKAAKWYETRLRQILTETGIDGFKFDAGESGFVPQVAVLYQMDDYHPENILTAYVDLASKFGGIVEVVSARGTQNHSIYTRMMDRESNWSFVAGFPTLITCLLYLNIIGYPFVLPDMVAGNLYNNDVPSAELFVRWVQANVFMPVIQFSYPPWEYDKSIIEESRKLVDMHYKYSKKIIELMKKATISGTPVNLPIWWIDPYDEEALAIDSEFLLGEDILVAPVITQGANSRDIYLPKGNWRDEANVAHPIIKGPVWLRNYPADLTTLPHFTRVGSFSSSVKLYYSLLIIFLLTSFIIGISNIVP